MLWQQFKFNRDTKFKKNVFKKTFLYPTSSTPFWMQSESHRKYNVGGMKIDASKFHQVMNSHNFLQISFNCWSLKIHQLFYIPQRYRHYARSLWVALITFPIFILGFHLNLTYPWLLHHIWPSSWSWLCLYSDHQFLEVSGSAKQKGKH